MKTVTYQLNALKGYLLLVLFVWFSHFAASANAPESVTITGKIKFDFVDGSGKFVLIRKSLGTSQIQSATSCTLNIIADDEYYNGYRGVFQLDKMEDYVILPFFHFRSYYVNENGHYYANSIIGASIKVANITTESEVWDGYTSKQSYIVFDATSKSGIEAYHHLTLGQPMQIHLQRSVAPLNVTIDIQPLDQKTAGFARRCLKVINGD